MLASVSTNYQQNHFELTGGNLTRLLQVPRQYVVNRPAIAPAPPKVLCNSNAQNIQAAASGLGPMLHKKKYTYTNMPYGEQLPSVARRNARERNRVKQVNNGFANLRQHLPQTVINTLSNGGRGANKKLSKVDTLRIAVEYIRGLQDLLDDADSPSAGFSAQAHDFDETSNDESYDYSSMGSPVDSKYQLAHCYKSETSASPTPSYTDSDISIGAATYLQPLKLEQMQPQAQAQQMEQPKYEQFELLSQELGNEDEQLDEEELLDYITLWQER